MSLNSESKLKRPRERVVKRLFAVSGNRCAFPKCKVRLVDADSGKVTGKICHIKGRKPGSARYDAEQTTEERHAFENLVLMCPIHHDVIDSDEESYTVARLTRIKADHETTGGADTPADDGVVRQLIGAIGQITTNEGSVIFSSNQTGGQVAHQITNIGSQPRAISAAAASQIVATLRQVQAESVGITVVMGDPEAMSLGGVLLELLSLAGWTTESGVSQAVYAGQPRGIIIRASSDRPSVQALGNALVAAGLKSEGQIDQTLNRLEIVVGAKL